jgi:hypothetical protein
MLEGARAGLDSTARLLWQRAPSPPRAIKLAKVKRFLTRSLLHTVQPRLSKLLDTLVTVA